MTARSAPELDSDVQCPRCRSDLAGDAWCPQCGLNQLPPAAGAGLPPKDFVPAPPEPAGSRRRTAAIGAVLALIVAAIGVTIAATSEEGRSKPSPPLATATTTDQPIATATEFAVVVTANAMRDTLQRYVDAYEAEDLTALGRLFAPELQRVSGTDAPEDLSAAMANYASQFSQLSDLRYSVSDIAYNAVAEAGGAAGSYRITSDSGVSTGTIAFGFRTSEDGLLINHIDIEPSS